MAKCSHQTCPAVACIRPSHLPVCMGRHFIAEVNFGMTILENSCHWRKSAVIWLRASRLTKHHENIESTLLSGPRHCGLEFCLRGIINTYSVCTYPTAILQQMISTELRQELKNDFNRYCMLHTYLGWSELSSKFYLHS